MPFLIAKIAFSVYSRIRGVQRGWKRSTSARLSNMLRRNAPPSTHASRRAVNFLNALFTEGLARHPCARDGLTLRTSSHPVCACRPKGLRRERDDAPPTRRTGFRHVREFPQDSPRARSGDRRPVESSVHPREESPGSRDRSTRVPAHQERTRPRQVRALRSGHCRLPMRGTGWTGCLLRSEAPQSCRFVWHSRSLPGQARVHGTPRFRGRSCDCSISSHSLGHSASKASRDQCRDFRNDATCLREVMPCASFRQVENWSDHGVAINSQSPDIIEISQNKIPKNWRTA